MGISLWYIIDDCSLSHFGFAADVLSHLRLSDGRILSIKMKGLLE